ncbi:hypothetical protein [Brevibacillus centrosporus]|uniref:hypothetical protein n=1 Tax=Brevibacillus centrosporus TaxID=54910 RepID=UPI002E1CEBD3|nr:hypothetical protein [Brevibacillus centrosporus]
MSNSLRKLRRDNELYFRKCLKIRDKKARIIPFEVNDSQRRLDTIIADHYAKYPDANKRPTLYIIILKARQQGMSTFTEGVFFKAITIGLDNDSPFNKVAMVVSYDDDSAKTVNDMSWRFLQYLPDPLKPMNRPIKGKGIYFENPNREGFKENPGLQSKFIIDTANNKNAGSGYTINYLHISELAKWHDAETTMTSLMQSVPDYNAVVIVESTAMGVGGYFYDLWQNAERGENDYHALFIPWFEHNEYATPLHPDEEMVLDEDEKNLRDTYGVTLEQLKWRRETIKNKLNGDPEKFKQEYPSNAREAFLTSGRARFDTAKLERMLQKVKPGKRGSIYNKTFVAEQNGYVEMWEKPIQGRRYVIGADVSEGLATGDYSYATVWDAKTWKQVTKWRGHVDPDLYGEELDKLGRFYNEALLAVEKNNHGFTTLNTLKNLNYPNLFMMEKYDKIHDKRTEQVGFQTTRKTKPLIIDHLAYCIREGEIETNDETLIKECITYVREDDGSTNAQEGCFDDGVMASAIALFVLSNYISEYFTASETNAMSHVTKRDEHLPHALQDDQDNNASWHDL